MKTLTTKSTARFVVTLLAFAALLGAATISCSDKPSQTSDKVAANLDISIPKSSLADQIDIISLQVIVDDEIVDTRQTQLVEGKFDFGTFTIPTGEVTFVIEAIDTQGLAQIVLYSNTVTVMVEPGDDVSVPITLLPAVPMAKLSPYYDEAASQTTYTATLELWNILTFNNGIFSISYDPAHFEFESAVEANSNWGTLDVLASFNTGEVILDINRPLGLETIPATPELALVRFTVLGTGTETLDLSVDALSDNDGIVPEFASGALFVEDATVEIISDTQFGSLSGTVRNATNNSPVPNALVTITGPTSDEINTNSLGEYSFSNLPFGTYQLEVAADGFITRTSTQIIDESQELANISLSTSLAEGQYRIVLTWGGQPEDLDAHFYTVVDAVIFEVYFFNPGAADQLPFAILDVDDVDGFGPETITVFDQVAPIVFAVHNYSQFEDQSNPPLSVSQAQVDLYEGNQLLQSFEVSQTATQQWWHIFEIAANGELIIVNTYSDNPPAFTFGKQTPLPAKAAK